MLGIVWSTSDFNNDIQYYAKTVVVLIHEPLVTLTCLTFWLIIYLLGIRNIAVLICILPGLLIEIKTGIYKKIKEKENLKKNL